MEEAAFILKRTYVHNISLQSFVSENFIQEDKKEDSRLEYGKYGYRTGITE